MFNDNKSYDEINSKLEKLRVIFNASLKSPIIGTSFNYTNEKVLISSEGLNEQDISFLNKLFTKSSINQKSNANAKGAEYLYTYLDFKDLNEDFMNENYNRISKDDHESFDKIEQIINKEIKNSNIYIAFNHLNRGINVSCPSNDKDLIEKIVNLLEKFFNGEVKFLTQMPSQSSEAKIISLTKIIPLKLNNLDKDKMNSLINESANTSLEFTNQESIKCLKEIEPTK